MCVFAGLFRITSSEDNYKIIKNKTSSKERASVLAGIWHGTGVEHFDVGDVVSVNNGLGHTITIQQPGFYSVTRNNGSMTSCSYVGRSVVQGKSSSVPGAVSSTPIKPYTYTRVNNMQKALTGGETSATIKHMRTREIKQHLQTVATRVFGGPNQTFGKIFKDTGFVIAGGAIASLLRDEEPVDYDCYAKTLQHRNVIMEDALRTLGGSNVKQYIDEDGAIQIDWSSFGGNKLKGHYGTLGGEAILTQNALTVENTSTGKVIQIVLKAWGEIDEIVAGFDFAHSTCAYDTHQKFLSMPSAALQSLLTGELKYLGNGTPLSSLMRVQKFTPRGYTISKNELLKIALDISQQNLADPDTLLKQLDGAYGGFALVQDVLSHANGDKSRDLKDVSEEASKIFGPNLIDAKGEVNFNEFSAMLDHIDEELVLVTPKSKFEELVF